MTESLNREVVVELVSGTFGSAFIANLNQSSVS
jgi:hypothetical protein